MRLNCIDLASLSCQQALHFERRERARVNGEAARGGGKGELSFVSPPRALASPFARGRFSSDFSRLPQVESLLVGYARLTPEKETKKN